MGFKGDCATRLSASGLIPGMAASAHAMNMRAVEAIVSSAPNPMKIF
jgi:hypothetical protein